MGPDCVVLATPALDQEVGLGQRVEDLAVRAPASRLAVDVPDVAVLPGASGRDEQRLQAEPRQLLAHDLGRKFCTVVRAQVRRGSPIDNACRQLLQYVAGVQPPCH